MALLVAGVMGLSGVSAQDGTGTAVPQLGDSNPTLVAALRQGGAQITYHAETGAARFISAAPGTAVQQPTALAANATREQAARGFMSVYGTLFGINNATRDLVLENEKRPDASRTFERFQQVYNGIPVLAGEVIVQVDNNNNILSANGEALPKIYVPSTTPGITAAAAAQTAVGITAKVYHAQAGDLLASTPALWIYNPVLLTDETGTTKLVWRIEVTPKNGMDPIRELVLIDAVRGTVVLHFSEIDNVLQQQTYTAHNGTALPGVLVCTQANPNACNGDQDAHDAHVNAAATYNFYFNMFGRNSINNAGMIIKSTVHYGNGYDNANWNGTQMIYGDAENFAHADDVVAHELTHGVTQYESGLFYYYQSGAINESFSDVFGELVDQQDGIGTDTADWQVGEDMDIGALRNMQNPTIYGDPDRVRSGNYWTAATDNGGVHSNSGINNHAAYLIAVGGTFNGKSMTGLGNVKMGKIYYEAQTNLLTSGADYGDLYDVLYRACFNLIGSAGITVADCQQVRNVTDATEMNLQPLSTNARNPEAPVCPIAGQYPSTIMFNDDMENGTSKWIFGANYGINHWRYDTPASYGPYAHSGLHELFGIDVPDTTTASYAAINTTFNIPSSGYYLWFAHSYGFEDYLGATFDGGVLQYSNNGGLTWLNVTSLETNPSNFINGYNGTISIDYDNPLAGQQAFVGDSHGYISSRLSLDVFEGTSVRFRWNMGLDFTGGDLGWAVDDVMIYNCSAPPSNDDFANATTISLPHLQTHSDGASSLETVEQFSTCEGATRLKNSVWFKYNAASSQPVTFSLVGTTPAAKGISVWTGSTFGNLTQVGCAPTATQTAVKVDVNSGTTYYIRVGSPSVYGGNFTLGVAVPPNNDDFADATLIQNDFTAFSDTQNVTGASVETGDPAVAAACSTVPAFRTVWYKFISLGNNTITIDTATSDYDTVLSVWTGAGLGALAQAACNDNAPAVTTSAMTFNTVPAGIYYIRVSTKSGTLSTLNFHLSDVTVAGSAPIRNFFTTDTPTLTWNRVSDATQYEIQISKSSTFVPLVGTTTLVSGTQLSFTTPSLGEGVYYYRVRALRGSIVTAWNTDNFTIHLP